MKHDSQPPEASLKLHKVLAEAGLGSRRVMEQWIREGRVTVNGTVAGIGLRVIPGDLIKIGRRVVHWPAARRLPRVLLYHKPEGEIVSRDDPEGRATVFAKLPPLRGAKWLAVGRLDYNTCGLLIFTTSGELAHHMMHPRFDIEREYAVRILGQLSAEQITRLKAGIALADGTTASCVAVADEGGEGSNRWYRVVLKEGRNRIVRRVFEALGLTVSRLMRVRFGIVGLPPRLKRGRTIELTATETKRLLDWLQLPAGPVRDATARAPTETRSHPRRSSRAR
jgi:23S rRNA pseudouridine2605 synthase